MVSQHNNREGRCFDKIGGAEGKGCVGQQQQGGHPGSSSLSSRATRASFQVGSLGCCSEGHFALFHFQGDIRLSAGHPRPDPCHGRWMHLGVSQPPGPRTPQLCPPVVLGPDAADWLVRPQKPETCCLCPVGRLRSLLQRRRQPMIPRPPARRTLGQRLVCVPLCPSGGD